MSSEDVRKFRDLMGYGSLTHMSYMGRCVGGDNSETKTLPRTDESATDYIEVDVESGEVVSAGKL